MVGFTCGRFAGRLEASIAPAGFCGGAPLALLAGVAVAGLAATGFATGFAAGFATGFAAGFAAAFGALFGFAAGLALPPMSLANKPFFSGMRRHVLHQVGYAAAVAPFVVVPGDDLHELVTDHHGAEGVNDR
ncbi:MAG: hypothetical protein RLZZ377_1012 [Chloroflexota bacterium]